MKRPPFVGSRWWCPSWLEVPGGPWGASASFRGDVVAGWKAALDWYAENGLNVIIGSIPFTQTDRVYEGWGFHYVLDFKGWPHAGHITLARGERSRLADFASEVL